MRRKRNIFTYEIDRATMPVNLIKGIIQKEDPQMEFKF
jgi:hypothetical protein